MDWSDRQSFLRIANCFVGLFLRIELFGRIDWSDHIDLLDEETHQINVVKMVDNEDNDDEVPPIPHVVTAVEILREGLLLLIEEKVILRRNINSQIKTFNDNFGMKPTTACVV